MPSLSREQFLQPLELKREQFPLAEWGWPEDSYVVLRGLTATELIDLQKKHGAQQAVGNIGFVGHVLRVCLIDDAGSPLFQSEKDVTAILGKSPGLLTKLAEKALAVSGIALKDDGEPEKN